MLLILQHIEIEGPGYIKDFFEEKLPIRIIKVYQKNIPQDVTENMKGVIVLGGQ